MTDPLTGEQDPRYTHAVIGAIAKSRGARVQTRHGVEVAEEACERLEVLLAEIDSAEDFRALTGMSPDLR